MKRDIFKNFDSPDHEIVILHSAYKMINGMVNLNLGDLAGSDPDCEFRYKSDIHLRYFNLRLNDFLTDTLIHLKSISRSPNFNEQDSVLELRDAVKSFESWLENEATIERVWFPTIDKEMTFRIRRLDFIRICGNISKHDFTQLGQVAERIIKIFQENNQTTISYEDAL